MLPEVEIATLNTIGDGLRRAAQRFADKEAVIFQQRRWTYQQLDQSVNRVANYLLQSGLHQGDRVAAYGKNSDAYLILFLACARAGIIHVPINFALVQDELLYLLGQSGAVAVFMDEDLSDNVAAILPDTSVTISGTLQAQGRSVTSPDILQTALSNADHQPPAVTVKETDLAQILYTSGTTSHPKGAMHTHRGFMAEYNSCIQHLYLSSDDRSLCALPLYHSAQMHVFTMPALMIGATSYIMQAPLPQLVFEAISNEKLNSVFAPPTVWIGLLRDDGFDLHDLSSLVNIYYGASIMPEPIVAELQQRLPGCQLFNCYGQSEMAPIATVLAPEEQEGRLASIGKPVMSVETRIVDPVTMQDCPVGERGEIIHRSPHVMVGYWEKPEQTAEAFSGGWFHSGDLAYADEEGYLYIVDRIKDVVNTGGVLVASRDVEEALYLHPAVAEVAVIGTPHERWIEAITAVIVFKAGEDADSDELVRHCQQHLAPFKVPKSFIFTDALPKNTAGKLLKRALREQYNEAQLNAALSI
ncbi:fatty acyl-CoA synthetase [Amphritea balenae]|uniref:Long-chain-fatty-acid--CoA ligase n=1 Tax=Amphritea balenae TaxID=452629 RepID=A0A3P1SP43_9GAMM|nr:fatty acyl-CoA synthetase [Amphritea balenae]RRC98903.1 long-chain-fatty-acid--CoA ligase [Amphritea balenae]GGK62764.1 acyl-CoA synthetase [Amphritea balenae]